MADYSQSDDSDEKAKDVSEEDKKFLELIRSRFRACAESQTNIRRSAEEDLIFLVGEQWPDDIKRQRELDKRPCPVINILPTFVRQITNEQRQNRPSIKVDPIGDGADQETAEIQQGMIRHIETNSNADLAYDTAFAGAVQASFGFFRALTDYCDPMSFDQEILIKHIENQFLAYLDPSSKMPDGSDANFGFVSEDLSEDEFKDQWPNAERVSAEEFKSIGDDSPYWRSAKTIRVAEYLYKDFKEIEIAQLKDQAGTVVDVRDLVASADGQVTYQGVPVQVAQKRKTKVPTVKWAKVSGLEILERGETVFDLWIPLFPVLGEKFVVKGEVILKGLVRDAKDPQRMQNYWKACETETISLAPRTPWVAAEGQIEGYEDVWETAHSKNHSVLPYIPVSLDGTPCPPPQRQSFEPPVAAITNAYRESKDDMKGVTGIFDAGLGNRSNENSGRAIDRRNAQTQTTNFHFVDNFHRTLRHAGRVIVRALPKVYDTERMTRIIREDGTSDVVKINGPTQKPNGEQVMYDMSKGNYDSVIDTGPSFATKRQEGAALLQELSKAIPAVGQVAPDLIVKASDIPYASEVAKRLKKSLPPGIADDENQNQQIPPQIKAELEKNSQMVAELAKANQALHDERDSKILELESKERIALQQSQTQIEIALLQTGSKESMALLAHQVGEIQHRLDLLHSGQPIGAEEPTQEPIQNAGPEGAELSIPTGGAAPGSSMESP